MREDGVHQLLLGGLEIHRHHVTLDEFGDLGPAETSGSGGGAGFGGAPRRSGGGSGPRRGGGGGRGRRN